MRKPICFASVALFLGILGVWAQTKPSSIKPCEELKAEIDAELKAKGVTGYMLEIKPANEVKDEKVVGSCEGGTKKITYYRK